MAKFKALLHEPNGCDYTIGCGYKIITIDADNISEAEKKVIEIYKTDYEDNKLDLIELYEISNIIQLDINKINKEIKDEKDKLIKQQKMNKELKLLEQLKNKYEK